MKKGENEKFTLDFNPGPEGNDIRVGCLSPDEAGLEPPNRVYIMVDTPESDGVVVIMLHDEDTVNALIGALKRVGNYVWHYKHGAEKPLNPIESLH